MKQYVNPLPTGGVPIFSENVNDALQKEMMDAIQALASATADGQALIVSGCIFASLGGGNYSMSAGIVLLDGVLMRIDAVASTTLTKYIAAGTPTVVTAAFEDGGTKNLTTETKAVLLGSAPGSGQYITITTANFAGPPSIGSYLLPTTDGAVGTANLADAAVTPVKVSVDIFRGRIYTIADDLNNFVIGTIQHVTGGWANAPTAIAGDTFRITTYASGAVNGNKWQEALQVEQATTGRGTIRVRQFTAIGATWSAWTTINS